LYFEGGKNMEIKEETYGIIWGTVLLMIGLIILLVVLSNILAVVSNPLEKLEEWAPEELKEPHSFFYWWSKDKSVEFNDASIKGSAEIIKWNWDFGDDSTSSEQNPDHTYLIIDDYTVVLEVEDENGKINTVRTRITLIEGENNGGQTQTSMSLDLGLDTTFNRLTISIVILVAFAILVMIGGRFLVAGCRLIRPNVKFLNMKIKPKERNNKN
jgi:hypothetical protein